MMSDSGYKYSLEYMELVKNALHAEKSAYYSYKADSKATSTFSNSCSAVKPRKEVKNLKCRDRTLAMRKARKREMDLIYARERRFREKKVELELQSQFSVLHQANAKLAKENTKLEALLKEAQAQMKAVEESKQSEEIVLSTSPVAYSKTKTNRVMCIPDQSQSYISPRRQPIEDVFRPLAYRQSLIRHSSVPMDLFHVSNMYSLRKISTGVALESQVTNSSVGPYTSSEERLSTARLGFPDWNGSFIPSFGHFGLSKTGDLLRYHVS